MAMSDEERSTLAPAAWAGVAAIVFTTDPLHWPAFVAFARKESGEEWTEAHRLEMRQQARVLKSFAKAADAASESRQDAGTDDTANDHRDA